MEIEIFRRIWRGEYDHHQRKSCRMPTRNPTRLDLCWLALAAAIAAARIAFGPILDWGV
jgi:hypothetical protein